MCSAADLSHLEFRELPIDGPLTLHLGGAHGESATLVYGPSGFTMAWVKHHDKYEHMMKAGAACCGG